MQSQESLHVRDEIDRLVPLVVDLDGTLVRSDLLIESAILLMKRVPLRALATIFWLVRGRAYFKEKLARNIIPDVQTLAYDEDLISYLTCEKQRGRRIVLATGADERLASAVASHLGIFDHILASDGKTNLSGKAKSERLIAEFGRRGFDYVGNDWRDRIVWEAARKAVLVRPVYGLVAALEKKTDIVRIFDDAPEHVTAYLKVLRPLQWLKNMLVFAPLAFDYQLYESRHVAQAALAFVAFSMCASSGYLFNDLMDLSNDRHHPRKKARLIASGQFPAKYAFGLIPALLLAGMGTALLLPWPFLGVLAGYYVITLMYSYRLKEVLVLDVLVLAVLYTLRVIGGALAVGAVLSFWLLAFCVFLFFSLALVKRYAELATMHKTDGTHAHARAYLYQDRELLAALGGSSGYLAALVLGLFIGSRSGQEIVSPYQTLWVDCLLLMYWITYVWLAAHRGRMHDDPMVFALRDTVSCVLLMLMLGIFAVATFFNVNVHT